MYLFAFFFGESDSKIEKGLGSFLCSPQSNHSFATGYRDQVTLSNLDELVVLTSDKDHVVLPKDFKNTAVRVSVVAPAGAYLPNSG